MCSTQRDLWGIYPVISHMVVIADVPNDVNHFNKKTGLLPECPRDELCSESFLLETEHG